MVTERLKHELSQMLSLERKPIIEGWTTQQKAEDLAGLIIDHKPMVAVEVGVFGGRSLFAQALAMRENGMGIVWGVDPWTLEAALEGDIGEENRKWWSENVNLEDIYVGFVKAVLDLQLTKYCRWVRERGEIACKFFTSKSIDLLHLDSNHSEMCSCRDVRLWQSKVKPGGFLIIDDVKWETQSKALDIIKSEGWKTVIDRADYIVFQKANGTP
jgi:hypothetical protein